VAVPPFWAAAAGGTSLNAPATSHNPRRGEKTTLLVARTRLCRLHRHTHSVRPL
jgi:hypothetical protein